MDDLARTVLDTLSGYADRGVFGRVDVGEAVGGALQFTFGWYGPAPIRCVLAPPVVTLKDFLPAMPARSDIYKDLRELLDGLSAMALTEHRSVDPARAAIRTQSRGQLFSLSIESLDGDYVYATRKLIFAAHEVWLRLQSDWDYYMCQELGAAME